MNKERILVVEKQEAGRALTEYLQERGYEVSGAETQASAEATWRSVLPDLTLIDADLPNGSIERLVTRLQTIDSSPPIIVLASFASVSVATAAVGLAVERVLTKPLDPASVLSAIKRSLENRRNHRLRLAEIARTSCCSLDPFVGQSDAIKVLRDLAQDAALSGPPVLIEGETGTGKGVLARWLHQNSAQASEPFVEVNCARPRALLEVELFGEDRPSLPSDSEEMTPAVEIAHRGTLFLDAIDNFDPLMQPKLLRLLAENLFRRLGGSQDRRVDLRLIGATHRPLSWLLQQRQLRGELRFQARTTAITLTPLGQRVEDIPALADYILCRLASVLGTDPFELSPAALSALQGYSWPGNIRELSAVLQRAALAAPDSLLTERDLVFDLLSEQDLNGAGKLKTLEEFERHYIHQVLRKEGGHVESAARRLGIPRSSLYHKLKHYRKDQLA
jgi:DNA-binding NtrC family response regulator